MEKVLRTTEKVIPKKIYRLIQPVYHWLLAFIAALRFGFPSRKIKVVFVTGTKGKSTTVEYINAILEAAGYKTALAGTIRFKIGEDSQDNMYKMTIPGRFFVQRFLRRAVNAGCQYAIVEMTSEGAKQFRHLFISLDALVFLNLSPEHIESHGSYEKYVRAKLRLARALEKSRKPRRILVANTDDKEAPRFLSYKITEKYPFSLAHAEPYTVSDQGVEITFQETKIKSPLPGTFTAYNLLAAATFGLSQNISPEVIKKGIEGVPEIRGRAQKITLSADHPFSENQNFDVIIDYAHTIDSLTKLYEAFPNHQKVCVLGNTGGGRDKWKRPGMAKVADTYCDSIILTDEDPYDDDPREIVEDMAKGISQKPYKIVMDRREAIRDAISQAYELSRNTPQVAVLITGKGTDPFIMRADGKKDPWSDAQVAREEIENVLKGK